MIRHFFIDSLLHSAAVGSNYGNLKKLTPMPDGTMSETDLGVPLNGDLSTDAGRAAVVAALGERNCAISAGGTLGLYSYRNSQMFTIASPSSESDTKNVRLSWPGNPNIYKPNFANNDIHYTRDTEIHIPSAPLWLDANALENFYMGESGIVFYDPIGRQLISPPCEKISFQLGEIVGEKVYVWGEKRQRLLRSGRVGSGTISVSIPLVENQAHGSSLPYNQIRFLHGAAFSEIAKEWRELEGLVWISIIKKEPGAYALASARNLVVSKFDTTVESDKVTRLNIDFDGDISTSYTPR